MQSDILSQLSHCIESCTRPTGPRMYRELYGLTAKDGARIISSWEEWNEIPPLTIEYLSKIPFREKLFKSVRAIESIRASSGTSGRSPLFTPRGFEMRPEHDLYAPALYDFTSTATLTAWPIHRMRQLCHLESMPHRLIGLDYTNLSATARLARDAGVTAIFAPPGVLPSLARELAAVDLTKKIRFLEMSADLTTHELYEYVHNTFPNADVYSTYSISEAGGIVGIPCRAMDGSEPIAIFHPNATVFFELIDPETGNTVIPASGAEGELCITTTEGGMGISPLIRYRTRDRARIVDTHCHHHGTWSFVLLGRADIDSIKIPGGLLRADIVAQTLRQFSHIVSDEFEAHCRDARTGDDIRFSCILMVKPIKETDLTVLAHEIEKQLYIGPKETYFDAVLKGRCEPLICAKLSETENIQKRKRIVRT